MRTFYVLSLLVTLVSAETFVVTIGNDNGLTYDPPSLTAKRGDIIAFQFVSKNHTVTQSSFATPCERLTTPNLGVDSGYLAVPAGATSFPQWSFTLADDSAPLWFYCAQSRHCQSGMVFALNPTPERTFEAFKATAMGAAPPAAGSGSAGQIPPTAVVPGASSLSGSLTSVTRTGTAAATGAGASGTSASGSNSGAISTGLAGKSGLSGLMIVLGLSLCLI